MKNVQWFIIVNFTDREYFLYKHMGLKTVFCLISRTIKMYFFLSYPFSILGLVKDVMNGNFDISTRYQEVSIRWISNHTIHLLYWLINVKDVVYQIYTWQKQVFQTMNQMSLIWKFCANLHGLCRWRSKITRSTL